MMRAATTWGAFQDDAGVGTLVHCREDVDGCFALPLRLTKLSDDEAVNRTADGWASTTGCQNFDASAVAEVHLG